jgi:hypothetical protein
MAVRRKYKTPQGYRDGGAVPAEDVIAEPPHEAASPAPPSDDDAVSRALQGTERAEQLQRQRHPADGLSDWKRSFIEANPALKQPDIAAVARGHHVAALAAGIPDDSGAMGEYILTRTAESLEHRRALRDASSRARADDAAARQAAAELEREAEELRAEHQAEQEESPEEPMPAPARPMREPRRGIQYSAPISRDSPSVATGRPASFATSVTLSPAEREVARTSFSDPSMSIEERERLYAKNKLLMLQRRANGTLNE